MNRLIPLALSALMVAFAAWAYAKQRCEVLTAKPPLVFPADWNNVTADHAGTVISVVGVKPRS